MVKKEKRLVMKQWKIAIILVAVIGISIGAYFGVSKMTDKKAEEELISSGVGSYDKFEETSISSVSFTFSDGSTYDFTSEDATIWTSKDESIQPNDATITYALTTLSNLQTTKLVEKDASDLSIYGLDSPLTISCTDGIETYAIQVGSASPTGESYYIKSPDDNAVYTISSSDGEVFNLILDDLKDRAIIHSYVSVVNKLSYKEGDKLIFDCKKDSAGVWELTYPTIEGVETNLSSISALCDVLIRTNIVDFVNENPTDADLKQYGLDSPYYTIEIADDDEDVTLTLGKAVEDTESSLVYGRLSSTGAICTFNLGEFSILNSGAEAVLVNQVYNESKENLTNVTIEYEGQKISYDIDYDKSNRSFTYSENGKPIKEEKTSTETETTQSDTTDTTTAETTKERTYFEMVQSLINSTIQIPLYHVDVDQQPTGSSIIKITYTRNYEPKQYTIELVPTDESNDYYYVLSDGKYRGCIVRNRALQTTNYLLSNVKEILDYKSNS